MPPYVLIVAVSWLAFIGVWAIAALTAKRTLRRSAGTWGGRFVIFLIIVLLFQIPAVRSALSTLDAHLENDFLGWAGAVLTVLGIGFAMWARFFLGRNWGMPMSEKENRELVTQGPYAHVRHPIYTGMIAALFGTSLVNAYWLPAFILFAAFFFYSARTEEKMLTKEFPDTYAAYARRTKMLIPFVF